MTWPPQETIEFIDWLDREFGASKRDFVAGCYGYSEYESGAVWSLILAQAWKVGASFQGFDTRRHCEYWLMGRVRWAMRIRELGQRDRMERERRVLEVLAQEGCCRCMGVVEGSEGFEDKRFEMAWDALSPKRRAAVECVVVGGMRPTDVAEIEGVRTHTVSMNVKQGLDELRKRYDGTYVSRADAIRAAKRRKSLERVPA